MRALSLLLRLSSAAAAVTNAPCPDPSKGPLSCLSGSSITSTTSAGLCVCTCGASAASAVGSDGAGHAFVQPSAGSASCSVAACTAAFPSACTASGFVYPLFSSYASLTSPPAATPTAAGSICAYFSATLTPLIATALTQPAYLVGATFSVWEIINSTTVTPPTTVAQQCATEFSQSGLAMGLSPGAVQALIRCNTNMCNSPPSPLPPSSASAPRRFSAGVFAAASLLLTL